MICTLPGTTAVPRKWRPKRSPLGGGLHSVASLTYTRQDGRYAINDAGATLSHVAHLTGRDDHHAQGKALGNLLTNLMFSSSTYRLMPSTNGQAETTEVHA